ncbi:SRPBCC family protein [Streptomyces sp. AJS327]|uniref:SRPBCC family protein n=1 Tax=Streptomyces sp. AJS327 TaxID=2545265 RepID=UPI0015DED038|nr:SRPBCC family protein [Streptomyces sp. AJS327]MBA0053331.1 SRPBCC family protein [Streptomyces sp. AJS327]
MVTRTDSSSPPSAVPDAVADVPGLLRFETMPRAEALSLAGRMSKESFSYEEVYGEYVTVHQYIDAPPEAVFEYLTDERHLDEYTYSTRDVRPTDRPGLFVGRDPLLDDETKIYLRIESDRRALNVDLHCAWDQGEELWMIYLHRIVPAQTVLGKPGSVVIWTNCRHPYYDKNPYPELASSPDRPWVGDMWSLFYAGHTVEMQNLKKILEHRHGGEAA